MIKKSVHEDELIYGMQRELQPYIKKEAMANLVKAADCLQGALEIFEAAGLTAQADQVLLIMSKLAADEQDVKGKSHRPKVPSDPHTKGLTPERMVENLKHHGIVFNLSDDGKSNDLLDADVDDNDLEVVDPTAVEKDFEDES